jgi:ankyrin repeat protein
MLNALHECYRETPLHKAARRGKTDVVSILLSRHAEIKGNKDG